MVAMFGALLAGCGLTQTVSDATTSTARSVFYKKVKTLHLDFSGRASSNTEASEMTALSVPTLVRVYQLRDEKAFERADYEKLAGNDEDALIGDLLDRQSVVMKPEQGEKLDVPMHSDARFIAIVALLRQPDTKTNAWRLTLTRDDLDPDQPRVIELGDNRLTLRPLVKD
jgi:type VI secretion system protein VasD